MISAEHARQPNLVEISSGELRAVVNLNGAYLEQLQLGGVDGHTGAELLLSRQAITEGDQIKDRGGVFWGFPYIGPGGPLGAQHGYARAEQWATVPEMSQPDRAVMALEAVDDRFGPYQGLWAQIAYDLSDGMGVSPGLTCELHCWNGGDRSMVVAPGLHPYFPVGQPRGRRPENFRFLTSKRESDTTVREQPLSELGTAELIGGTTRSVRFSSADGRPTTVESRDLPRVAVWSGTPGMYVCIEPTLAGFIDGEDVPRAALLHPGQEASFRARIVWNQRLEES